MNTVGVLQPSVVEAAVTSPPAGLVRKELEAFSARSAHVVSVHVAAQVKVLGDAAGGEFVLLRDRASDSVWTEGLAGDGGARLPSTETWASKYASSMPAWAANGALACLSLVLVLCTWFTLVHRTADAAALQQARSR